MRMFEMSMILLINKIEQYIRVPMKSNETESHKILFRGSTHDTEIIITKRKRDDTEQSPRL